MTRIPSAREGGGASAQAPGTTGVFDWALFLSALGGAILGGLILNIMPCVFPILSLKALALARAGGDERTVRQEGMAYAAGTIITAMLLGAVLMLLRAGGEALGWAFQLQRPESVVLLIVLMGAVAANLAGLFEFTGLSFSMRPKNVADTDDDGARGAFLTGALAAFIATPCTGPFMGAALGFALILTLCLVMLGAWVRLTDAGLGCPDWPGCYGKASPLGAHADTMDGVTGTRFSVWAPNARRAPSASPPSASTRWNSTACRCATGIAPCL